MQTQTQPFNDSRGGLQRRQTTDLGKMAGITPIGQQPTQAVDPLDLSMVCTSDFQQSQVFFLKYCLVAPIGSSSFARLLLGALTSCLSNNLLILFSHRLFTRPSS